MAYSYTKLEGPFQHKHKYNVYGVVKEIRKCVTRENGKLTMKFSIEDETIKTPFYVSVFCKTGDECIPHITIGSIVRMHRMQAELFKETFDGRIFSSKDIIVFPKETFSELVWVSDAKQVTLTESDRNRVKDLVQWAETVQDLGSLTEADFSCSQNSTGANQKAGTSQVIMEVEASNRAAVDADQTKDPDLHCSRSPIEFKFLGTRPLISDPFTAESKDLLVWKCVCKKENRTSKLLWIEGPQNLGSTKCPDCGVVGMAIPEFRFEAYYSLPPNGRKKRVISGNDACEFLGTSEQAYAFTDGVSRLVHSDLMLLARES